MSIKIALAGNPNCGKTTIFNALTGSNQYVGNWPGVTVEKKEGQFTNHRDVTLVDLPGVYSLSPYTLEEVVTRKFLIDDIPQAIIDIVDGSNIERNLYLTTQLLEIGVPVVIAINMMDIIRKNGDELDTEMLAKELNCEVVEISALKNEGIDELAEKAVKAAREGKKFHPRYRFSGSVEHALAHVEEACLHDFPYDKQRYYAIKLFERDEKIQNELKIEKKYLDHIEDDIKLCEIELDDDSESIIINERYNYVGDVIAKCFKKKDEGKLTVSDKIDRIVTNRWLALPLFALIMFIVYYVSVTTVGSWATDWAKEGVFGNGWSFFGLNIPGIPQLLRDGLEAINCAGWLQSLLVDGIVGGVGAVLSFVPQLLVLFIFLGFLEGCGYMSRVAFIMDRLFRKFGLSGKSFIPMLIGTGCSVPGIMASRTIENPRDRKMTIMTTPFIPCSAKLPAIALIAGALFNGEWWVAPCAYFIGVMSIVISGIILKKTKLFSGEISPFVMELPSYHMPTVSNILKSMWERAWSFIKKAGTVIVLSTIVIWFTQNFGFESGSFGSVKDIDNSILAYIGKGIAWIFAPLGWGNWQSAVSSLTGLIAKENIVGTFSVIFHFGGDVSNSGTEMYTNIIQSFTALSGFSFLIFNLLCVPCMAAVAAIRREMNSAKWTFFAIGYQCVFAYIVSLCTFQFGSLFIGNPNIIGLIFACLALAFVIYMIVRKGYVEKKRHN